MIVVDVDSASLARLRLTPSPAYELVGWLMLAAQGRRHPVYGDPGAAARSELAHPDVALVAGVLPQGGRGYLPDLLTPRPAPGPRSRTLSTQFDAVAATPAWAVAEQLAWCGDEGRRIPDAVRSAAESGTFAARAAAGLRRFWQATLADRWPVLRELLDADIRKRSYQLADFGVGDVLGSLHEDLRWTGGRIEVDKPYDEQVALVDADLVLAPSALRWPALSVQVCHPADAVMCYPVDGLGAAAPARPRRERPAVSALLGDSRAQLLVDLTSPRSTGELSARHQLAPATVSHHLGVLLRAGLVHRMRDGRIVRYHRSSRGDALIGE